MANWCSTVYVFYGENQEGLDNLYNDLKKVHDGTDTKWIGEVYINKGFNKSEAEELAPRSFIMDVNRYGSGEVELVLDDAWSYHYDEIGELISRYGDDIYFEMLAEERGCEIFVNTDADGVYFPDRYLVNCEIDGDDASEYFSSTEAVREYISELLEKELNDTTPIGAMSFDEIMEHFKSKHDSEGYLRIEEFDYEP